MLQIAAQDNKPVQYRNFIRAPQELLSLFQALHVLVYREEGQVGDTTRGWRHEAMLVAQKV